MLPLCTCAKYTTFILVKTHFDDTEEVLTPSQIAEIFIFYCSSTDSNTFIRRKRENAIMEGGGGIFYELLIALYFIFLNNLNTFFKKNSILVSL